MQAYNRLNIQVWDKYSHWEILSESEKKWKVRFFKCICKCWNIKNVALKSLRNWNSQCCWCINIGSATHWMKGTTMYNKWRYMRERCSNKSEHKRKSYLDKWITVCPEWNDFMVFYKDMKVWFSEELELDRKDNSKWYYKENCRWVTKSVNCKNRWNKPLPLPPK